MCKLDFLYRMALPHRAVSVYIYLCDKVNKNGECWPAIPTIAKELKLSESTVRRALKDLPKAGLLETGKDTVPKAVKPVYFTKFAVSNSKKVHLQPRFSASTRWQVLPVNVAPAGESKLPNLRNTTVEREIIIYVYTF